MEDHEAAATPERMRLDGIVWDYVRVGWTVQERTGIYAQLVRGPQTVRLSLDEKGQVAVDGPPLPAFYLGGRAKAWLLLLALMALVFGVAWLLGFFRF